MNDVFEQILQTLKQHIITVDSIVARYPKTELTDADRDKIKEFFGYDRYFMYEL